MFLGGSTNFDVGGGVKIDCDSRYPREGHICYTINPVESEVEFDFAIHIPGWCKNVTLSINGEKIAADIKDGYAYISRVWKKGDTLEINAELPVIRVYSNLAVSKNAGLVCLQRGPVVYCFEEVDNGALLGALRLPPDAEISLDEIEDGILKGKTVLSAEGIREVGCDALYTEKRPKTEAVRLQAVPYYTWGNREPGEMRVWIRE
jgi:DUF1680 family protein